MEDIILKSSKEIISLIDKREIFCVDFMKAALAQVNKYDPVLESFISLYGEDELIKQAGEADIRRKNGSAKSSIDGLPVALKDNIHSTGIATTCASKILENYMPPFDATVTMLIKEKGGIVLGKTNLDEFAMGSTCENSSFNHTRNPWDIHRVPGGSSGGSAVAVASGMVPFALGSDTGGSIRQPASFCGVVGLKPTYGLVSRYGLAAYASSLDQIGPLSRDVYGSALMLNVISGFDKNDSTSLDSDKKDYTASLEHGIRGMRIAVIKDLFKEGISPEIQKNFEGSLEVLRGNGAIITEVSLSSLKYVISTYYFIATAEACSNLSRYDGVKYGFRSGKQGNYQEMLFTTRSYGFGKEVKKRILLGNFVLSSGYYDEYYRKAQKTRTFIREELKGIFQNADMIAMPTAPDIAFPHGEGGKDPMKIYLADITTVIPNLAGIPAVSVPSGIISGMPAGLQLMGRPLEEDRLLSAAACFEKNRNSYFHPPLDKILEHKAEPVIVKNKTEEPVRQASVYTRDYIKKISDSYMKKTEKPPERVLCSGLPEKIGKTVSVFGWIHRRRSLGGIEFYDLRDRTGFTQLVIEGEGPVEHLNLENVVEIRGKVTEEERSPYGNIEIKVKEIKVLSHSEGNPPVSINSPLDNVNLPTILDARTVSIRNPQILYPFKVQAEIVRLFAEFLNSMDFTGIKSTKITSSGTEGGTNLFELKYFDRTAYLAQSPQFYKQIMVGSGFERVFEIGPVFRAEHHDTVRHLNEYISLDFEMGFIRNEQDIIDMQEALIRHIFKGLKDKFGDDSIPDVPKHIPRIHFLEAMEIVQSMGVRDMEEGDISPGGEKALCEYFEREKKSSFVYVIGYPIKKRPMYTMPDERLPGYTRSFDLIYRGLEITTGGQRIHDYHQLRENIVEFGFNPGDYKDYLNIFRFGMPPHGGLGMGLERLTMKILNLKNVREASLFPRDIGRITP